MDVLIETQLLCGSCGILKKATSFPVVDASDALVVSPDSELFFSTEISRKLASEISIHLSKLTENDPREK